jgi:IS30 family transposase
MISLLTPFAACVHTLTTDNGKEFASTSGSPATLGADFFFAHPYASWERGANENMNGLIRQFFPKKCAFDSITQTGHFMPCIDSIIAPENASASKRLTRSS